MAQSAVVAEDLSKSFGPTVALDRVRFDVPVGTVHALLGENGAGKSTLVKVLSGLLRPDRGRVLLFDAPVRLRSARDAHRHGISTAFQELTLVPTMTVAENMRLPESLAGPVGVRRRRDAEDAIAEHLAALGLDDIPLTREVSELSLPVRQKLEIARAVWRRPRVLLLDEPTSALSGRDIDWLGGIIASEKQRGTTVIFISHRLPEVRAFCDVMTILRNGAHVGTFGLEDVSDREVVELIIGRSLASTFPSRRPIGPPAVPLVEARNVDAGAIRGVSLTLHPGEIVGIAALQGMGQWDLFSALFGDRNLDAGTLTVGGTPVVFRSPADAIDCGIGISLVPEDRKSQGLFLELDGRRNISLPIVDRFVRHGLIDGRLETDAVLAALARGQVDGRAAYTRTAAFSGGNQQKIILAKWLLAGSRILLLFDPTRGVDVGTKHEIYLLIHDFVERGGAVLLYSTEIAEVAHLSHRVLVIYRGRVVRELDSAHQQVTEAEIMRAALGYVSGRDWPAARPSA